MTTVRMRRGQLAGGGLAILALSVSGCSASVTSPRAPAPAVSANETGSMGQSPSTSPVAPLHSPDSVGPVASAGATGRAATGSDVGPADPVTPTGIADPVARQSTATRTIGRSVEGRKITATAYGDPNAPRVVAVIGVIHGSETAGSGVTRQLARLGAASGTRLWVVPNVNPDGTRRASRQNSRGVDLNRNTPDKWQSGPHGTYYPGTVAASEPETRAYLQFLTDVRPDLVLIFHQHLNGVDSYGAKDSELLQLLSGAFGLSIKSFNCSGVCRGTLTGWFNAQFPGSAVTIELPASVTSQRANRIAAGIRDVATRIRDAG